MPALAEDRTAITVRVGETVSTEVGYAMGFLCDDETIVRGEMRNKDADTNVFAVTGLAVGTTLCRAGTVTVENRPSYLFEITVTKPAKSRLRARSADAPATGGFCALIVGAEYVARVVLRGGEDHDAAAAHHVGTTRDRRGVRRTRGRRALPGDRR